MQFLPKPKFGPWRRANHGENAAVRGCEYQIVARGRRPFRIAKKCSNPEDKWQPRPSEPWRESKEERVGKSGDGDERPAGPMNDGLLQIVTCVPISTTRLGGKR